MVNLAEIPPVARLRNPRGEGARLREELIGAASEMIADSAHPSGVTLRGLAKTLGIAPQSIYRHFPDVEHLLMAVVDREFAEFNSKRDRAREDIAEPADALLAGCRAYCEFALGHPGSYRFMFSHRSPADGSKSAGGAAAFDALAAGIERCQAAGVAPVLDNPELLAAQVWASLHGLVLLRLNAPQFAWPATLQAMAEHAVSRIVGLDRLKPQRLADCEPGERR